jgi:hypothetical protein
LVIVPAGRDLKYSAADSCGGWRGDCRDEILRKPRLKNHTFSISRRGEKRGGNSCNGHGSRTICESVGAQLSEFCRAKTAWNPLEFSQEHEGREPRRIDHIWGTINLKED